MHYFEIKRVGAVHVGLIKQINLKKFKLGPLSYSPFHKTLPKSGLQVHWTSVRFYEMGVIWPFVA